jgi:hypothetical protein
MSEPVPKKDSRVLRVAKTALLQASIARSLVELVCALMVIVYVSNPKVTKIHNFHHLMSLMLL